MTEILFPEISTDTSHVRRYFQDTPSDLGSVLHQEFLSAANFGPEALASLGAYTRANLFDDNLLSPEEYRESQYFREGIKVSERGIKLSMAQSLAESYDRRFKRDLVLSRARRGAKVSTLRFGAGIVGGILDPINLGVGLFAPVAVGLNATARAAAIRATSGVTQRYGKTAGRFVSGAGEAVIGAAAVEPLLYSGARIQQDPSYGIFDSFVNITLGSVLGGTISGVGGKFTDVLRRANPETVQQAYQAAIAQQVEGFPVDVDAVFDADMAVSPALRAQGVVKRSQKEIDALVVKRPKSNELPPSLKAINSTPTKLSQFVINVGRVDPESIGSADLRQKLDAGDFRLLKRGGLPLQEVISRAQEQGYFPAKIDTYSQEVDLDEFLAALDEDPYSSIDQLAIDKQAAEDLYDRTLSLGINPKGMTDEELFEAISIAETALTAEEAAQLEMDVMEGIPPERLETEIAKVEEMYERGSGVMYFQEYTQELESLSSNFNKTSRTNDDAIQAMEEDMSRLDGQIAALRDNGVLSDEDMQALQEFDDFIARVDELEPVINSGAVCVMRTPENG
jgi:hypothetical protein